MCYSSLPPSVSKIAYQQQYDSNQARGGKKKTFITSQKQSHWINDVLAENVSASINRQQPQQQRMMLQPHNMIKTILTDPPVPHKQQTHFNVVSCKTSQNYSDSLVSYDKKRRHDLDCSLLPHGRLSSFGSSTNSWYSCDNNSDSVNSGKRYKYESLRYVVAADTSAHDGESKQIDHASTTASYCYQSVQPQQQSTKSSSVSPSIMKLMRELCSWERSCRDEIGVVPGDLDRLRRREEILQRLYDSSENKMQQVFDKLGIESTGRSSTFVDSHWMSNKKDFQSKYQHQLQQNQKSERQNQKQQRHVHFAEKLRVMYPRYSQSNEYLSSSLTKQWYCSDEIQTNSAKCRDSIQKYKTQYSQYRNRIEVQVPNLECYNDAPIEHNVNNIGYETATKDNSCTTFLGLEKKIILPMQFQILHRFLAKKHVSMILLVQEKQKQQRKQERLSHTTSASDTVRYNIELNQNELAYASYTTSFPGAKRANRTALLLRYEIEN